MIIISEDFQEFYHIHPSKIIDESNFHAEILLHENNGYKAFVDISLKDKNDLIKPRTVSKNIEQFIHIHPKPDHETLFAAHFDRVDIYKLWGEFKFGPFVFEVKSNSYNH